MVEVGPQNTKETIYCRQQTPSRPEDQSKGIIVYISGIHLHVYFQNHFLIQKNIILWKCTFKEYTHTFDSIFKL